MRCKPSLYRLSKLTHQECKVQNLFIASKLAYEERLVDTYLTTPKNIYGYLKCQKSGQSVIGTMIHNSTTITNPEVKVEIFNGSFNSTFMRSSFILPPIPSLPTPVGQLSKIEINSTGVSETLCELDTSKAPGSDDISPTILKHCSSFLEPITHHLHTCLETCTFRKTGNSTK